jgi:ADP-ribose pyrophosphatase
MLRDERAIIRTSDTNVAFVGAVISVVQETFRFADAEVTRDVVRHPGAVGVVALRNLGTDAEILLVRQYRHPLNSYLWELPAGLRDIAHESAVDCARRELQEETGFDATDFELLITSATTPGGSDELISLFLTIDPLAMNQRPLSGEAEETDMTSAWVSLTDALAAVERAEIVNAVAQLGILLAAFRVRREQEKLGRGL